jgi:hypothetical protein
MHRRDPGLGSEGFAPSRNGEREPDALRRAGDERPLASQFEQFECHITILCCHNLQVLIAQATS